MKTSHNELNLCIQVDFEYYQQTPDNFLTFKF
jgi:hypothetical protein